MNNNAVLSGKISTSINKLLATNQHLHGVGTDLDVIVNNNILHSTPGVVQTLSNLLKSLSSTTLHM